MLSAIDVDVQPDVLAYLTAFGTVGAVVVALFGPPWHEWRRRRRSRPRLEVSAPEHLEVPRGSARRIALNVANATGRDRAEGLELLLSVDRSDGGGEESFRQLNVRIGENEINIPPGVTRSYALATVDVARSDSSPPSVSGAWLTADRERPLSGEGSTYRVTLVVAGSNFDAVTLEGVVAFAKGPGPDATTTPVLVTWSTPLHAAGQQTV